MSTNTAPAESPDDEQQPQFLGTASYDIEENKIRFDAYDRLSEQDYARAKAAGFRWAPQQKIFIAAAWRPEAEDLMVEWCGSLDSDDQSAEERAAQRAKRFSAYQAARADDADTARAYVDRITAGIPLGQPIIVGHHSEKRARKDAERIKSAMNKACALWETSEYWKRRAIAAKSHAAYRSQSAVRARRVKTLTAEQRKYQRTSDQATKLFAVWEKIQQGDAPGKPGSALRAALVVTNYHDHTSRCFPLDTYPRTHDQQSRYEGSMSLHSALSGDFPLLTVQQAAAIALERHTATAQNASRWIAHIAARLVYENELLQESGYTPPPKPVTKAVLPLLNYRAPGGVQTWNRYQREPQSMEQVEMTSKEYAAINRDYKATTESGDRSHRIRSAMQKYKLVAVFLTDSKQHPVPEPSTAPSPTAAADAEQQQQRADAIIERAARQKQPSDPRAAAFGELRQAAKTVEAVSAPCLFPTPLDLAERMARIALTHTQGEVWAAREGDRPPTVIEPSAGTGRLVVAVKKNFPRAEITAVEQNAKLAGQMTDVVRSVCADFMDLEPAANLPFDAVVMNPPFDEGQDIAHVRHAFDFLRPGGRLVAIVSSGYEFNSRLKYRLFREWLQTTEHTAERLPEGTFTASGTQVNTVLLVIDKNKEEA